MFGEGGSIFGDVKFMVIPEVSGLFPPKTDTTLVTTKRINAIQPPIFVDIDTTMVITDINNAITEKVFKAATVQALPKKQLTNYMKVH